MRLFALAIIALLLSSSVPALAADTPTTTPSSNLPISDFLKDAPPETLLRKNDPNTTLRAKLFTAWVHAHRVGKQLSATGEWQSTGSADRGTFSATITGTEIGFDWTATCVLPDADTDKALALSRGSRVTITGAIASTTYSLGTYGPELKIRLLQAAITDTAPPARVLGPIAIRNASALQRLQTATLIDPDKQKTEIDQMSTAAAQTDRDIAAYLAKNNITLDPGPQSDSMRHGIPYLNMPTDLLFLMGKTLQVRSESSTGGVPIKEILFATFGYSDDAFILTLKGDTLQHTQRTAPLGAKYYATPQDAPPPSPKKPTPTKPKPTTPTH